jgi:hypothetical protein
MPLRCWRRHLRSLNPWPSRRLFPLVRAAAAHLPSLLLPLALLPASAAAAVTAAAAVRGGQLRIPVAHPRRPACFGQRASAARRLSKADGKDMLPAFAVLSRRRPYQHTLTSFAHPHACFPPALRSTLPSSCCCRRAAGLPGNGGISALNVVDEAQGRPTGEAGSRSTGSRGCGARAPRQPRWALRQPAWAVARVPGWLAAVAGGRLEAPSCCLAGTAHGSSSFNCLQQSGTGWLAEYQLPPCTSPAVPRTVPTAVAPATPLLLQRRRTAGRPTCPKSQSSSCCQTTPRSPSAGRWSTRPVAAPKQPRLAPLPARMGRGARMGSRPSCRACRQPCRQQGLALSRLGALLRRRLFGRLLPPLSSGRSRGRSSSQPRRLRAATDVRRCRPREGCSLCLRLFECWPCMLPGGNPERAHSPLLRPLASDT